MVLNIFAAKSKVMRHIFLILFFYACNTLLSTASASGITNTVNDKKQTTANALFPCTAKLDNPYGVCTHITRRQMDYPYMERELLLCKDLGIGWVRSDFDLGNVFGSATDFEPQLFDDVVSAINKHNQHLLPIFTWLGKFPWDDPSYGAYVDSLASRYGNDITYWEMMNEVDFMGGIDSLPEKYAKALHVASKHLHAVNPNNKMLLTGLGSISNDFIDNMFRLGAMKDVDIMNLHSYATPEDMMRGYHKIDSLMRHYGEQKPVWLTECGMNTCNDSCPASGFYREMLPYALKRLGMNERKICVGYLADRATGYTALTPYQANEYLKPCASDVRPISFRELKNLSVKKVPVLVATTDEFFPNAYFPSLVDYVRRGGTIVLAGGFPFYYDAARASSINMGAPTIGDSQFHRLHMAHIDWKKDPATGEELTATPPMVWRDGGNSCPYIWDITKLSPARYLSDENLHKGDSLIPLICAGTPHVSGIVAGIYRLNSELKGNIVFQTRMYFNPPADKEAEQARRIARTHIISFALGVDRVFWYNLRSREDNVKDPEDYFGLIHKDFSEKPACQAYRALTRMLPSGSTRPALNIDENIYNATWIRPDGKRITAIWSPYVPVKKKADWPKNAILYDFMGNKMGAGKKAITLTDAVVYIVEE